MFIRTENLWKTYDTGPVRFDALKNINLEIAKGEICVILGPSGSGKSTLLNIIGGIDHADRGRIFIDGMELTSLDSHELTRYRRDKAGFIFQFYNLIPNLTVYENIEVVKSISKHPLDIEKLLSIVEMKEYKKRFPRELSGGQQQRVAIVRALVKNPSLLFCDEPTGALDYEGSKDILKLLCQVNSKFGTTVLIITHNNAISGIADRVVRLRGGEVSENRMNPNKVPPDRIEW
jgi:putative ABC transport system ATP-binding protein